VLYSNYDTISFDGVKSNLLSKEKFDHEIHADFAEELVARGRTTEKGNGNKKKNSSKSRNPHAGKTCNYCGKLGHIVANCYKLKNKKEKEEKNQSKKPAMADCVVESESKSDEDVLVATTSGKGVDDDWILGYGCSYQSS